MHPSAAGARGVSDGDVVRVFNDRGSCLAGVVVDDGMLESVVQLSTGAWYDPLNRADPGSMCVHGSVNVLTADVGSSSLSRGCTGQHVLVEIERYAFDPPVTRSVRTPPAR
jgi:biotin/methionine sulfoxide reductase